MENIDKAREAVALFEARRAERLAWYAERHALPEAAQMLAAADEQAASYRLTAIMYALVSFAEAECELIAEVRRRNATAQGE